MTIAVQARGRRYAKGWAARHVESYSRRQVMRGVMQAEAVAVAQPSVKLRSCCKVFPAEAARVRTCRQRERPAHSHSVAKFPRIAGNVLLRDEIGRRRVGKECRRRSAAY